MPEEKTPAGAAGAQPTVGAQPTTSDAASPQAVPADADPQPASADTSPQAALADADPQPAPAATSPQPTPAGARPQIRGVIIDWGGVMTNPILDTVDAWIRAEQIDRDSYTTVMRAWVTQAYGDGADNPIHALERGECTNEEFERLRDHNQVFRVMLNQSKAVLTKFILERWSANHINTRSGMLFFQIEGGGFT